MKKPILLLALCLPIVAQAKESQPVVIDGGDTFGYDGAKQANPLHLLGSALIKNPKAKKFRLVWIDGAPNMGTNATATYDRSSHIFRFFSKTFIGGLGNEGVPPQVVRWQLKGVADSMISRLSQSHKAVVDGKGDSYFSELTKFGAKHF